MMQKEVADRFTASVSAKDYNAERDRAVPISGSDDHEVHKTIFNPRPAVDSAVVQFTHRRPDRPVEDEAQFFALVQGRFKQRRQDGYNNFREFLQDQGQSFATVERSGTGTFSCGRKP